MPEGDQKHLKGDAVAIIVVDHGSRNRDSNLLLEQEAIRFAETSGHAIVEPAHMTLAEPSIAVAFDRCVARGARTIVVLPYFLLPGRHWQEDLPRLISAAADKHPGVHHALAAPVGLHPLMLQIMDDRVRGCLAELDGP